MTHADLYPEDTAGVRCPATHVGSGQLHSTSVFVRLHYTLLPCIMPCVQFLLTLFLYFCLKGLTKRNAVGGIVFDEGVLSRVELLQQDPVTTSMEDELPSDIEDERVSEHGDEQPYCTVTN